MCARRLQQVSSTTSDFHIVRVQEYERDQLIRQLGATASEVRQSYFVPSLQSLGAKQLAQHFASRPELDTLQGEFPQLYEMILSHLPPPVNSSESSLPLSVCVKRVVDESYWKRCCMERWSSGQLSAFMASGERLSEKKHGWKQLYLEHILSDFLLSLRGSGSRKAVPTPESIPDGDSDDESEAMWVSEADRCAIVDLCAVCHDYIHTLELPCLYTHFNWYEDLFSRLPEVWSFRLTYGVCNVGTDFFPSTLGFSQKDANSVRSLLLCYTSLRMLRLPNNRLKDDHTMAICAGLTAGSSLRVLDLSHNAISDISVCNAIAVLLAQPALPLEELYLNDNDICGAGAAALSEALFINQRLRLLQLDQNRIPDDAATLLICALEKTSALRELHLGNNILGSGTAAALTEMLPHLQTLASLHLAGNCDLGGGLAEAIDDDGKDDGILSSVAALPSQKPAHDTECTDGNFSEEKRHIGDNNDESTSSPIATAAHVLMSVPSPSSGDGIKYDGTKMDTDIATVSHPKRQISLNGPALCQAVQLNFSLQYIDVRYCGFTVDEERRMAKVVRGRADRN